MPTPKKAAKPLKKKDMKKTKGGATFTERKSSSSSSSGQPEAYMTFTLKDTLISG